MAENGFRLLQEYKEKFTDIVGIDYSNVILRYVLPATSVEAPPSGFIDIDVSGLVIKDEEAARQILRQSMEEKGDTVMDRVVFTIWGGALDPSGLSSIIEPILRLSMNHGGGVFYNGQRYPVQSFKKPLIIGGICLEWLVFCEAPVFETS